MKNNEYIQMAWRNVLSISLRQITSRLSWSLCVVALVVCLFSCDSDKPDNLEPLITTLSATDITRTDATLNGSVLIEGEIIRVLRSQLGPQTLNRERYSLVMDYCKANQ